MESTEALALSTCCSACAVQQLQQAACYLCQDLALSGSTTITGWATQLKVHDQASTAITLLSASCQASSRFTQFS
ncbi:hypothetical protein WJX82_011330 [Trebouxia sp. C0006]